MPKKSLVSFVTAMVLLASLAAPVLAVTAAPVSRLEKAASKSADKLQDRLTKIKERGDSAITERLTKLNALKTTIDNHKVLTTDQKTTLKTDIDSTMAGLTALKTKLDAEMDAVAALADYKAIFGDYRVYAVLMPKEHAMVVIDRLLYITDQMLTFGTKLTSRITQAKTAGNNTTTLDSQYADYTGKLTSAKAKIALASALLPKLTPANYPSTTQTLKEIRSDLKGAEDDIKAARKLAGTMVNTLKSFKSASNSASSSAIRP